MIHMSSEFVLLTTSVKCGEGVGGGNYMTQYNSMRVGRVCFEYNIHFFPVPVDDV
jgi:hypothetical protein